MGRGHRRPDLFGFLCGSSRLEPSQPASSSPCPSPGISADPFPPFSFHGFERILDTGDTDTLYVRISVGNVGAYWILCHLGSGLFPTPGPPITIRSESWTAAEMKRFIVKGIAKEMSPLFKGEVCCDDGI